VGIVVCLSVAGYLITAPQEEQIVGIQIITDDFGRVISVPENPERIISLAPSVTEIMFALGLEDRLVGIDDNSNYPEGAKGIERIGGYIPDKERIMALNPDLIIASDMTSEEVVYSLEDKGLIVICLSPRNMDGIFENIMLIGSMAGKTELAGSIIEGLKERINAVTDITQGIYKPVVYLEYCPYWTFGPGSFGNDLISMAGGKNIASATETEYPNISNEYIVGHNPEIIIFTVGQHATPAIEEFIHRPGWETTDAAKYNKIYSIDDDLLARPGPRMVDALEELAHLIHPELFP
jgi:ABC-type Fe3+-hydroxamate transport system, periplasmic component